MYALTWTSLQSFQSLWLFRQSYVWVAAIPIAAHVLEKIGDAWTLKMFSQTFEIQLSLPFSWIMLYVAALMYGLSHVIFHLMAPAIIRDRADIPEDAIKEVGSVVMDRYLFEVGMNWEGLRQMMERQDRHFAEVQDGATVPSPVNRRRDEYRAVYDTANGIRLNWRRVATFLVYASVALITVVIAQGTYSVLSRLFH